VSIQIYTDVHVPRAIVNGLRLRGVDVLRAQDDDAAQLSDAQLLDRATRQGCVLFTLDQDLLREAARRRQAGQPFAGVVYAHPLKVSIGQCIEDLELLAKVSKPEDLANQVEYLPLK
jgi:multidrug efflux pump subunit AcrA (membrane-fusion protein)